MDAVSNQTKFDSLTQKDFEWLIGKDYGTLSPSRYDSHDHSSVVQDGSKVNPLKFDATKYNSVASIPRKQMSLTNLTFLSGSAVEPVRMSVSDHPPPPIPPPSKQQTNGQFDHNIRK